MKDLKRSTPEEQGIPSGAIENLVKRLNREEIPMHGLLIARHGVLVAELYWKPFHKDSVHRIYSESKSFVSLAIGLLEADGKLNLQDHIVDHFPEYLPGVLHPWLQELTIEEMLCMETCFDKTVYNKASQTENWARAFFRAEPTHRPGTQFQYDTSATQVLACLCQKLTGMDPITFLKSRGFRDVLGISEECFCLKRPDGSPKGGSGMCAKASDMMKVGLMLMNGGRDPHEYGSKKGTQLIPEDYVKRATSTHRTLSSDLHPARGYGYQFWTQPKPSFEGFFLLGMGSNDTRCDTEHDLCVVTLADTQELPMGSVMIQQAIAAELIDRLSPEPLSIACDPQREGKSERSGNQEFPQDLKDTPAGRGALTDIGQELSISFVRPCAPVNMQELVNGHDYGVCPNPADFQRFRLTFQEDGGTLLYERGEKVYEIPFGIGKNISGTLPGTGWPCETSGAWISPDCFYLRCWVVGEEMSSIHFTFGFLKDGGMTLIMKKTEEVALNEFQGLLNGQRRTA